MCSTNVVLVVCMERVVGYCGIVCSECPVLVATKKGNDAERKKIAEIFNKQYDEEHRPNGQPYKPEDISCDGCMNGGTRVFYYCSLCGIRKCGKERKVKNCAFCSDYPCDKLSGLFNKYSKAKDTLDEIRRKRAV